MLTTPIRRYAKPVVLDVAALLPSVTLAFTQTVIPQRSVQPRRNLGLFDVLTPDGKVLSRNRDVNGGDYWFEGNELVIREPGSYVLRTFTSDPSAGDASTIDFLRFVPSDGDLFKVGVEFWPEVMTQPENGIARVSTDGKGIAICCPPGQHAVTYRMRNYLGQVSEPACLMLTIL